MNLLSSFGEFLNEISFISLIFSWYYWMFDVFLMWIPTYLVQLCPILLEIPTNLKIGHPLWTFPCTIILVHEQIPDSFLVRSQWIRFQIESALRMPAHKIDNLMVCLLLGSTFNSPCLDWVIENWFCSSVVYFWQIFWGAINNFGQK